MRRRQDLWNKGKVGTYHASLLRTGDNKLLMVERTATWCLLDHNREEYTELSRTKICGNTWAHPASRTAGLHSRRQGVVCVEMPK